MRRQDDRPVDLVLLLHILRHAGEISGRLKLQKTVFLAELALLEKHEPVLPHYKYFRYNNGPFSRQLWDDFDFLRINEFVDPLTSKPTERGNFILNLTIPELRKNSVWVSVIKTVDDILAQCRDKSGMELMNHVYGLIVRPSGAPTECLPIRNIKPLTDLIDPPAGSPAVDDWLAEAIRDELALSPEHLAAAVSRAEQDDPSIAARLFS
jgi:uncharacterized protein YwgA